MYLIFISICIYSFKIYTSAYVYTSDMYVFDIHLKQCEELWIAMVVYKFLYTSYSYVNILSYSFVCI
jgi:hypothetical protein